MSFSGIADLSGTIKIEGEKISVEFLPTVPQVGQGTIQWNIPTPVAGCATQSSVNSAYCGIVVVASRTFLGAQNIPKNGTKYDADPSLDPELHVGDLIGNALVIGAFYEGDKKARGEDLTTSMIVNDLDPDVNYYIGVYAVSCTLEYHSDGIRAYSDGYGDAKVADSPSISPVILNDGDGVQLTDATDLEPGREYGFEFDLNTSFPADSSEDNRVTVLFDGIEAPTYADLLDVINGQLADIDNPPRSATPPNAGSQYWNPTTKELQTFNGTNYEAIDDVIVGTDDPSVTPAGSYWFDKETNQLKLRNANVPPATNLWDDVTTIFGTSDPMSPSCDQYWFDGVQARKWSGTTWCDVQTFIQDTDPSMPKIGVCGQFWYNEDTSSLNKYNPTTDEWEEKLAIFWPDAPDSITSGSLWYSTTEEVLRSRIQFGSVTDWNLEINFVIGEVEPITAQGLYWYRESTSQFFQYDGSAFVEVDVLEWHEDPTAVTSCELWWNELDGVLYEFDSVNLLWAPVNIFTESSDDPLSPDEIESESFWLDTENNILYDWDGAVYNPATNYIDHPTDPTAITPTDVVAWYNPLTDTVQVPSSVAGQAWEPALPLISSDYDPENIPLGKAWFDEGTNTLKLWNGVAWADVPYTIKPIRNKKGDIWFDVTDNQLKEWDGKNWVPADAKVKAYLDNRGNLLFETRDTGCSVSLLMLIPGHDYKRSDGSPKQVTYGGGPMHSFGYEAVYTDNPYQAPIYINSNLDEDQFLFNTLPSRVGGVIPGADGLEGQPSYAQLGVGTDGTPDERRELAHTMMIQLGYPTVDVELTPEQLDYAITRAIEELRQRSDVAYRRSFFLLDLRAGVQNYQLTNKCNGFNSIVTVMGAHRRSGAFSGGYSSNSVFDQVFAQQLFGAGGAGGFDLTTLYLSQQHLELIEMMFATKLNFHFNETNRTLYFHQDFHRPERILLDTAVERTEQELFKDRWVKTWIQRHAMASARLMLAEVRGKYAALPGAGGGVSLNASDLLSTSAADFQECYQQLEDFVASNAEQFGAFDFVMG